MPERLFCGDNTSPRDVVGGDEYVAFTIHPESTVDAVYIGDELLGVGGIVAPPKGAGRKIRPFRYPVSGNIGPNQTEVASIVLQGWRCDEKIVPATKRAPYQTSVALTVGAGGGGETGRVIALGGGYQLAMRVPFQGRRHASFTTALKGATAGVSQVSLVPVGIRYMDPAFSNLTLFGGYIEEATATTFTSATNVADTAEKAALTLHVGGFDSEEHYDEVLFYVKLLSAAWNGQIFISAEANGERNA